MVLNILTRICNQSLYLETEIFSSWNRILLESLSPAFGNLLRRLIMASCMLSGVWACWRVRIRPISFRQLLNVVNLILKSMSARHWLGFLLVETRIYSPQAVHVFIYMFFQKLLNYFLAWQPHLPVL